MLFSKFIQSDSDAVNLFKCRMDILCTGAVYWSNNRPKNWFVISDKNYFWSSLLYEIFKHIVVCRKSVHLKFRRTILIVCEFVYLTYEYVMFYVFHYLFSV